MHLANDCSSFKFLLQAQICCCFKPQSWADGREWRNKSQLFHATSVGLIELLQGIQAKLPAVAQKGLRDTNTWIHASPLCERAKKDSMGHNFLRSRFARLHMLTLPFSLKVLFLNNIKCILLFRDWSESAELHLSLSDWNANLQYKHVITCSSSQRFLIGYTEVARSTGLGAKTQLAA